MYLVLLLSVLWCAYALCTRRKRNASSHKLPPVYPGALPIIGHTHILLMWVKDLYGFINSMSDFCLKSGGVTCGYFAGNIYYGVVDPEDALTVNNSLVQRHHLIQKFAGPWLGGGLITGSGPRYKHHRRLLNPAFSLPVIHRFLEVFNDQSRRLNEILESHVGRGPVDTVEIFKNITLRTTCLTVFGDSDEKDKEFINKYIIAVDELFEILQNRAPRPWLHSNFLYSFSSIKKKQDKNIQHLDEISYEVIERKKIDLKNKEHLGNLPESDGCMKPFIDLILELAADGSFNDREIKDELNTIVITSYETTSQQLTYIAVILGSYPEVQDKIYEEIMEVVGERDVEKNDLSKLVYTEAVIKECLRMIPPLALIPRYVDKDLKLKNYTLRAGSYAFYMPGGINRHPAWGPDADVFRPERWLDKETSSKLNYLLFAFGFGPRGCIGRKYAMVSIKISLVHMLRLLRLKADFSKMKIKIDCVTRPASGHEVLIERRNK